MQSVTVALYLDTRRQKNNGLYPLKLQVYHNKQVFYSLYRDGKKIDLSKEDFERSYQSPKPRQEYKELKQYLEGVIAKANGIVKALPVFSFPEFERRMFTAAAVTSSVNYHYIQYTAALIAEGRIGTAESYTHSLSSLTEYRKSKSPKAAPVIQFSEITPDFLTGYEKWMIGKGRSRTTVGIYLRPLRAIFNTAIEARDLPAELYPFPRKANEKGKYQIPTGKRTKKALNSDDLKKLFAFPTLHPQQIKARAYWFFSFMGNGMNVADIARLKNKNLQPDAITFYRTKTINTTKKDPKLIQVPLNEYSRQFIAQYRSQSTRPDDYLFPILSGSMNDSEKLKAVKNFTRFINQHVKDLAEAAGLPEGISSNWGRHSFTTSLLNSGVNMKYIQDALGHQSMSTTENYFSGFESSVQKHAADTLMGFITS